MKNKGIDYYDIPRGFNSNLIRFKPKVILGKPFRIAPKVARLGEYQPKLPDLYYYNLAQGAKTLDYGRRKYKSWLKKWVQYRTTPSLHNA